TVDCGIEEFNNINDTSGNMVRDNKCVNNRARVVRIVSTKGGGSANDAKLSIWESPPLNIHDLLLSDTPRVPYPRA
ncbi:hypothetical protein A2U01_0044429, partial [Trifolium medium]|nr:hypothetical protein [Trifolium medium]